MKNTAVFKTENGNAYVLDGYTNLIANISDELYGIIQNNKEIDIELIYKNADNNLRNMMNKWPMFKRQDYALNYEEIRREIIFNPYPQLILNITQNCNLRCKYCIFSGSYEGYREHTYKRMTFDIAKKSVDLFAEYCNDWQSRSLTKSPVLSFYGGEPLLDFGLVKKVVEYVKSINFSPMICMTTNGTLLDEEKIKYLVENDFIVSISLDGSKELHDRNRVFANGEGTHDAVYTNIQKLKEEIKRQGKEGTLPILILTCYDDSTDMVKLSEYFQDKKSELGCYPGRVSKVLDVNVKENHKTQSVYNDTIRGLYRTYLNRMKTYDLSRDNTDLYFLERMFGNLLKVAYIRNIMPYGNKFTELLGGICVPGSKISVSVDGKFHICEKMNEFFPIGDCDNGLEHAAIEKIIRMWSESFIRHCNDCPFKALCGACFAVCNNNDTFQFEDFCKNRKAGILNQLSALYTLLEENPEAWAYLTRNESLKLEVLSKYNGVINKC